MEVISSIAEVRASVKKRGEWTTPSSSSESRADQQVEFFFTLEKLITEWYGKQPLPEFFIDQPPQPITKFVQAVNTPHRAFDTEATYTSIERELTGWEDLSNYCRKRVIEKVLLKTRDMLKSVSPEHNVLSVNVKVTVIRKHTFILSDAVRSMIRKSIKRTARGRVLTKYARIRLLQKKISIIKSLQQKMLMACDINGIDGENCPICLEDYFVGCQAARMPCSHFFHFDCIVELLFMHHYCPICEFEMPIATS